MPVFDVDDTEPIATRLVSIEDREAVHVLQAEHEHLHCFPHAHNGREHHSLGMKVFQGVLNVLGVIKVGEATTVDDKAVKSISQFIQSIMTDSPSNTETAIRAPFVLTIIIADNHVLIINAAISVENNQRREVTNNLTHTLSVTIAHQKGHGCCL